MTKIQADIGRQGIVVAAAVVLGLSAAAYVGYGYWNSKSAKPTEIATVRADMHGTPTNESDQYQQVLHRYNTKNANQAAQEGQTYLSVPSTRAIAVKPASAEQDAASAPIAPPSTFPSAPEAAQATASVERRPTASQPPPEQGRFFEAQVQAMMSSWVAPPPSAARVTKVADYAGSLAPALGNTGRASSGAPSVDAAYVLIPGYTLAAAELHTNIDTDETSVTEACIPAGPLAGACLYAQDYKRLGDSADFTFNAMAWHGRTYKVNAKPVDMTTQRTSLRGEVNNRYWSRIVVPSLALGLAKAGQLYQESGTQAVVSPLGGVTITSPQSPGGKAVAGTVIGGMAQQAGTVLAQDAAAEPVKQVTVPADTTIGIRFLAPVTAADEVTTSGAPPAAAREPRERSSEALTAGQQELLAAQQAAARQVPVLPGPTSAAQPDSSSPETMQRLVR